MIPCEQCGKELNDKDCAGAITTGVVRILDGGFVASDEPWLMVFCEACLEQILKKIRGKK